MVQQSMTKFQSYCAGVWAAKLWLQKLILVVTCLTFTSFVMIQIVFRYFLFLPLHGLEELAVYLAVWTYFIGGAYGAYERSHISASLLPTLIKNEKTKAVIATIVSGITTFVAVWMTIWAAKYLSWSIERQPMSLEIRTPMYWVHASMFIGLGLMSFYFLLGFIDDIRRLLTGRDLGESPRHVGRM